MENQMDKKMDLSAVCITSESFDSRIFGRDACSSTGPREMGLMPWAMTAGFCKCSPGSGPKNFMARMQHMGSLRGYLGMVEKNMETAI